MTNEAPFKILKEINSQGEEVEVLYQWLGDRWYAFCENKSNDETEIIYGVLSVDSLSEGHGLSNGFPDSVSKLHRPANPKIPAIELPLELEPSMENNLEAKVSHDHPIKL